MNCLLFQDSGLKKSNRHLVRSSVVSRGGLSLEDDKDLDLNPLEINVNNIYTPWTRWSRCKKKCKQVRKRYCTLPAMCGTNVLKVVTSKNDDVVVVVVEDKIVISKKPFMIVCRYKKI